MCYLFIYFNPIIRLTTPILWYPYKKVLWKYHGKVIMVRNVNIPVGFFNKKSFAPS